ncbi:MAG: DUF2147 domain-containing protein [Microscillaceae bacterium]|jgi:uncharacterized protein (DUF2147 family)|nr:DUF2147 domain-containing protein [Microscillaceae bacterium]
MMTKKLSFSLFFALVWSLSLVAQTTVVGEWKTIDDETGKEKSVIRIFKATNGKYYGKVVKLLDTSSGENPLCTKCTDDRKNKPILEMILIKDMVQSGNEWKSGKILDPEKGQEYSCRLWVENGKLKVRGYWGIFYRTQTWYRVSE